jgi:lactate 2-monooxygenase
LLLAQQVYVHGNAGSSGTYMKHLEAFKKWSIMALRLRPSRTDRDGNSLYADTATTGNIIL